MKKTISIILAAIMLIISVSASLISCGASEKDIPSAAGTTAAEETTTVKLYLDDLGKYDFNGETFTALVRATRIDQIDVEEEIGEIFNDAVYKRNSKVSERFNIDIEAIGLEDKAALWNTTISGSVMANDAAYDVVMPDYWWGCETGGWFLNMRDYDDTIAFEQPWWCAGWNDNAEIYGQIYSAVGSYCIDLYKNTMVVFFNKMLAESYKLESPYALVDADKWTLDKMMEMAAASSGDVNGDGVLDLANDRFGAYYNLWSGRALLHSCGWECASKTDDGAFEYRFWNDDFVKLYDRVFEIINNTDYVNYSGDNPNNAFTTDRLLFYNIQMGKSAELRDMASDFGIVPYPKYNEAQENFISYNLGTYYMAIPLSAGDPQMSAVVLEALNAETYASVIDAYYEINLKEKFSRDTDTQRMLDLVVDAIVFDFTFVNEAATDHIVMYFFDQIAKKNANISSAYEAKKEAFQLKLEQLFETYAKQ